MILTVICKNDKDEKEILVVEMVRSFKFNLVNNTVQYTIPEDKYDEKDNWTGVVDTAKTINNVVSYKLHTDRYEGCIAAD